MDIWTGAGQSNSPGLITGISVKLLILFEKHEVCMGCSWIHCLGNGYYNIGFVFNKGSFQALSKVAGKIAGILSSWIQEEHLLQNELSLPGSIPFFIDLTTINNKLFRDFRAPPFYIGGVFLIQEYWEKYSKSQMIAKKQFDGLIVHTIHNHLRHTNKAEISEIKITIHSCNPVPSLNWMRVLGAKKLFTVYITFLTLMD